MNKRRIYSFILFICLFFLLNSAEIIAEPNAEMGPILDEIEDHFDFFKEHFPRHDGSGNEKRVITYIKTWLRENGLDFSVQRFERFADAHSFSENIVVSIPGAGVDSLLIVVPLNHPIDADPGGESWNPALGLGVLRYCKAYIDGGNTLPMGITVLFAGGEFVPDSPRQLGSELFLQTYYPEDDVGVIYFRIKSVPGRLIIKNGEDDFFSPYWIINRLAASFEESGVPYELGLEYTPLYRLGISNQVSAVNDYLRQELPAVELSSGPGDARGGAERGEWLASFLYGLDSFTRKEDGRFPSDWDRHYIYFEFGNWNILVTEGVYIPLLIGIFTAILLFIFFFRRRMGKYRIVLIRKFWVVILLFLLICIFLLIGTYVIRGISAIRLYPDIWETRPLLFFLLKLSAALSLFFFLFRFVKRFPFPKIRSFYSASAIFLFFMLLLVVSVYNISLTYFFVWAFLWTVLFSVFQNRFAKMLCLIVASFSLLFAIYQLFHLRAVGGLRFIIPSPVYGDLFLSLILLPFILMIIRTVIAFHDSAETELHVHGWVLYAFPVALFATLIVYCFLFNPFSSDNPRQVRVREIINYELEERELTALSEAPLTTIMVGAAEYGDITAPGTNRAVQYSDELPELLEITYEKDEFLDRKYYTIFLQAEGNPISIKMVLQSRQPLVIYDSNFPFRMNPSDNTGEIFIGAFPPLPLEIEVVLPADIEADAQFIVEYFDPPYDLELSSENAEITTRTTCIKWIGL